MIQLPVWRPVYNLLKLCAFPVVWEVSVGAAVFREQVTGRQYLLLQHLSGHYDFPKGHMEFGETEEMTLRREIQEETGISDLEVVPLRLSIRYFYRAHGTEALRRRREHRGTWIFKQVHFFPARTQTERVVLSHEHRGYVWLPYRDAVATVTFENARRVLRHCEDALRHDDQTREETSLSH